MNAAADGPIEAATAAPESVGPGDDPSSFRRQVAAAIGVGLLVRCVLALLYRLETLSGDDVDYHLAAVNLAQHATYSQDVLPPLHPTVFRPPLASFFFAAHIAIFGDTAWPIIVSQSVLGLAAAICLGLAVRKRAPTLGMAPVWALATVPFGAIYACRLLTETLSISLLSFAIAAILWFPPRRAAIITGITLGLASLARDILAPLVLVLPVSAALVARWSGETERFRFREIALSAVLSGLVIAPWTARNFAVGLPTVVSKGGGGVALWIGTWERNDSWQDKGMIWPAEAFSSEAEREKVAALSTKDEASRAERDNVLRGLAIARITSRPLETFKIWLIRAPRFWLGSRTEPFTVRLPALRVGVGRLVLKASAWGLSTLILVLGFAGAVRVVRQRHLLSLFVAPIVYLGLIYFPFHSSESRYSEPVLPLLVVLSLVSGAGILAAIRARRAA